MKNVFTILGLLITTMGGAQIASLDGTGTVSKTEVKISEMKISVKVDSAEDLENTFTMEDIEEAIDIPSQNENISFEIICNDSSVTEGVSKSVSYKAKGNTSDKKHFLKTVERIREASIAYYNNKK